MPLDMSVIKINFLISHQKYMLLVSKEPFQLDGSFENPKHMFTLMGKKIFTILCSKNLFVLTYDSRKEMISFPSKTGTSSFLF